MLRGIQIIRSLLTVLLFAAGGAYAASSVDIYKDPGWGCCSAWGDHLRANGFRVNSVNVPDPIVYRRRQGIPDDLGSCHTAIVEGYAIEGHVPAREVKRLLAQRPKARGLAVARMPAGSPGMEGAGHKDPFDVILVLPDGSYKLYARYNRDGSSQVY